MRRKRFREPSEGHILKDENWELKIFHHIISENNPMTWYNAKDYYWHLYNDFFCEEFDQSIGFPEKHQKS
ncbi:unnamed protein product [Moneuplotes crassus]|uniref:Uncharacterized protein n=1 Tax=Euplotes crassus TaxID=5936 RepID=A0AAD1XFT4_EUPCR|nr:unnamed protein product [Moneuplotes crassus]